MHVEHTEGEFGHDMQLATEQLIKVHDEPLYSKYPASQILQFVTFEQRKQLGIEHV